MTKERDLSSADENMYYEGGEQTYTDDDVYRVQPFVDGIGDYDEYQQSWRFLGYMIDCNVLDGDVNNNNDRRERDLSSNDGETGEGCKRYLLWAGYVDLAYEGGGIGEYQYYDVDTGSWDASSCNYGNGNGRCQKMDCHLDNTEFSLLGFFKHESYDDWMEQLFKHEGVCVWGYDQYDFMNSARETWPQGCTDSGNVSPSGKTIYYDLKPTSNGSAEAALYTDAQCIVEYQKESSDDTTSVENILGNFLTGGGGGSGDGDYSNLSFKEAMNQWDYGMEHFKVCQPCVAYNLRNVNGGNGQYNDDYMIQGDNFDCYDQADYTNVNQCMKFMAKTTMQTATFRDLSLAKSQGTLVNSPMSGFLDGKARSTHYMLNTAGSILNYIFLGVSCAVLFYGITNFWKVRRKVKLAPKFQQNKEPLVFA